jgi:hypothetical protein
MKTTAIIVMLLLCGCASIETTQIDESPERKIATTTKARSWFSSQQTISKLKATTTDKTQSIGTDGVEQRGATNTAATIEALGRLLQAIKP